MALMIRKPGEGYWTRLLSAIGAGMLILSGAAWVWTELSVISDERTAAWAQSIAAVVVIVGLGGLAYWLMNKANVVEFFIATEAEMRKVNWPSRQEIVGSTWVVILGTFFLVALLYIIDLVLIFLFSEIGILQVNLF